MIRHPTRSRRSWSSIRPVAWLAGGAWVGVALALAAAAAWFRLSDSYDADDQFVLQILTVAECALATAGLVCSLPLLVRTAISPGAAKVSLFAVVIPVVLAFALQLLGFEGDEPNRRKNARYLQRQGELLNRYHATKRRMPESFDRALEWSGQRLRWRGDADGNPVAYHKLDEHAFLICAPRPRLHLRAEGGVVAIVTWGADRPDPCRVDPPR